MNIEKLEKWKEANSKASGYAHFDEKFGLNSAWSYVTNPKKVQSHSFFPFITYDQVFYKIKTIEKAKKDSDGNIIKKAKLEVKDKIRPICYSAHIDRCIYQYYGYILNEYYNDYVEKEGFSSSIVAYRTNLHKNNIHFAKQAFDFIKQGDCNIIVGDFKGFFDNLDHKYLKNMLCKVLGEEKLPPDWYAVYKNITRYSTWDLIDILKLNGLITDEDIANKEKFHKEALKGNTRKSRDLTKKFDEKINELNGFKIADPVERAKKLALTKEQFKNHKKEYLKRHNTAFGIPQGSSISAVLSNVYMVEFDKKLYNFVQKFNGLYLRYSDDFIIILPRDIDFSFDEIISYLKDAVNQTDNLTLEASKTQIYTFENNTIFNISDNTKKKSHIDYLGFIFDGNEVTLRPKTVSKYYYRMYKKLNTIVRNNGVTKNGNKISYSELYNTYTLKGRNGQYDPLRLPEKVIIKNKNNPYKSGNFFSYVQKSDEIFNPEYLGKQKTLLQDKPKEPITRATKRHMLKIRIKRNELKNKPAK
ncbi:MAG: reverse transcriptase/maturase family protein [Clostridia bacterium]